MCALFHNKHAKRYQKRVISSSFYKIGTDFYTPRIESNFLLFRIEGSFKPNIYLFDFNTTL
jgi:hypothetical protein